ncbi:MAG TPA: hypothetical protein VMV32_00925 [Ignavibacteriaceae bacterium]|nr:hypothetical protein [Ignavibacteriaceae bacterium]
MRNNKPKKTQLDKVMDLENGLHKLGTRISKLDTKIKLGVMKLDLITVNEILEGMKSLLCEITELKIEVGDFTKENWEEVEAFKDRLKSSQVKAEAEAGIVPGEYCRSRLFEVIEEGVDMAIGKQDESNEDYQDEDGDIFKLEI